MLYFALINILWIILDNINFGPDPDHFNKSAHAHQ